MAVSNIIGQEIEKEADPLLELSRKLWLCPETKYEEIFAHDALTEFLERNGFTVSRRYKLDTAFRAVYKQGQGSPHVVVICEYDALPEIGHACGHNLIAEVGVAAGLGLKAALLANPAVSGTVTVLGTPAEENGGGGKVKLIDAGALHGADVAMMAHPDAQNMMAPGVMANTTGSAVYTGRAAHAAAAPWEGVNALDAAVAAYTSMSMLRQQTKPDCRMHAVITEGGVKPNIIPERSALAFTVRATSDRDLAPLKDKVTAIMKSAAVSTGCELNLEYSCPDGHVSHYANLIHNTELLTRYQMHWSGFGPQYGDIVPDRVWASTDMGNISQVVPSIHPTFRISASDVNIHSREFTTAAMEPQAHAAARCAAKAIASVGWDVLTDEDFLRKVKESFQAQRAENAY